LLVYYILQTCDERKLKYKNGDIFFSRVIQYMSCLSPSSTQVIKLSYETEICGELRLTQLVVAVIQKALVTVRIGIRTTLNGVAINLTNEINP